MWHKVKLPHTGTCLRPTQHHISVQGIPEHTSSQAWPLLQARFTLPQVDPKGHLCSISLNSGAPRGWSSTCTFITLFLVRIKVILERYFLWLTQFCSWLNSRLLRKACTPLKCLSKRKSGTEERQFSFSGSCLCGLFLGMMMMMMICVSCWVWDEFCGVLPLFLPAVFIRHAKLEHHSARYFLRSVQVS